MVPLFVPQYVNQLRIDRSLKAALRSVYRKAGPTTQKILLDRNRKLHKYVIDLNVAGSYLPWLFILWRWYQVHVDSFKQCSVVKGAVFVLEKDALSAILVMLFFQMCRRLWLVQNNDDLFKKQMMSMQFFALSTCFFF